MALTRFKSGITVLRETVLNSIYGGLYGTTAGALLPTDHPLNSGHVHNGEHADGYAQKIDLDTCVTGQLDGANIQDNTVTPDKLTEFTFDSVWSTASNVTSNSPGTLATDSLVFGSSSLNDDGNSDHDKRMLFDKSNGSFRAGSAASTQWDTRGQTSVSFGSNCTAQSSDCCSIGSGNLIDANSASAAIVGGVNNTLQTSPNATILGGEDQQISASDWSVIAGGSDHTIGSSADRSSIIGGQGNNVSSSASSGVVAGVSNSISGAGDQNAIIAGDSNSITTTTNNNAVLAGNTNLISGTATRSAILAGSNNTISTGATDAIVFGMNAFADRAGQVAFGGGTFPGDTSNLDGQAMVSEFIVMANYSEPDSGPITLTLDGNSGSASNVFICKAHSLIYAIADWVFFVSDGSTPPGPTTANGGAGTSISLVLRTAGTTAITSGLSSGQMEFSFDDPVSEDNTFLGLTGNSGYDEASGFRGAFEANGAANGAFVFRLYLGSGINLLGLNGRAIAKIKLIQVRYDGT